MACRDDGKAGPQGRSVADIEAHRAEFVTAGDEAADEQRDEAIEAGDQTAMGMAGVLQRNAHFRRAGRQPGLVVEQDNRRPLRRAGDCRRHVGPGQAASLRAPDIGDVGQHGSRITAAQHGMAFSRRFSCPVPRSAPLAITSIKKDLEYASRTLGPSSRSLAGNLARLDGDADIRIGELDQPLKLPTEVLGQTANRLHLKGRGTPFPAADAPH